MDFLQKFEDLSETQKKTVLEAMAILSTYNPVSDTSSINSNENANDETSDGSELIETSVLTTKSSMKQVTLDNWLNKNRSPSTSKKGVDKLANAGVHLDSEIESVAIKETSLRTPTPKTLVSKHKEREEDPAKPDLRLPRSEDIINANAVENVKRLRVVLNRETFGGNSTKMNFSDNQYSTYSDALDVSLPQTSGLATRSASNNKGVAVCKSPNTGSIDNEEDSKNELQLLIEKMNEQGEDQIISNQRPAKKTRKKSPVVTVQKLNPLICLPEPVSDTGQGIDSCTIDKNREEESVPSVRDKSVSNTVEHKSKHFERLQVSKSHDHMEENLSSNDQVSPNVRKIRHKKKRRLNKHKDHSSEHDSDSLVLQSIDVIAEAHLQSESIIANANKGSGNESLLNSPVPNITLSKTKKKKIVENRTDSEKHPPIPTMKIRISKSILSVDTYKNIGDSEELKVVPQSEKNTVQTKPVANHMDVILPDHLTETIEHVVNNLNENQNPRRKSSKKHSSTSYKDMSLSDALLKEQSSLVSDQLRITICNDKHSSDLSNQNKILEVLQGNVSPVKKCEVKVSQSTEVNSQKKCKSLKVKATSKSPSAGYSNDTKETTNSTHNNKAEESSYKTVISATKNETEVSKISPSVGRDQKKSSRSPNTKVVLKSPSVGSDLQKTSKSPKTKVVLKSPSVESDKQKIRKSPNTKVVLKSPSVGSDQQKTGKSPKTKVALKSPSLGCDQLKTGKSSKTKVALKSPTVCSLIKKDKSPKADISFTSPTYQQRSSSNKGLSRLNLNENSSIMQQMVVSSTTEDSSTSYCSKEKSELSVTPKLDSKKKGKKRKAEGNVLLSDIKVEETVDQVIISSFEKYLEESGVETCLALAEGKDVGKDTVSKKCRNSKSNENSELVPYTRRLRSSSASKTKSVKEDFVLGDALFCNESTGEMLSVEGLNSLGVLSSEGSGIPSKNCDELQGALKTPEVDAPFRKRRSNSLKKSTESESYQQNNKLVETFQRESCEKSLGFVENLDKSESGLELNPNVASPPVPQRMLRKRSSSQKHLESCSANVLEKDATGSKPDSSKELENPKSMPEIEDTHHSFTTPFKRVTRKTIKGCKSNSSVLSDVGVSDKEDNAENLAEIKDSSTEKENNAGTEYGIKKKKLNVAEIYNVKKDASFGNEDSIVVQPLKIHRITRSNKNVEDQNSVSLSSDNESSEGKISEIFSPIKSLIQPNLGDEETLNVHTEREPGQSATSAENANKPLNNLDINAAQRNYSAFCKMKQLCESLGISIDDLFEIPKMKDKIHSLPSDALFFITKHKLQMKKTGFNVYLHNSKTELVETLQKLKQSEL